MSKEDNNPKQGVDLDSDKNMIKHRVDTNSMSKENNESEDIHKNALASDDDIVKQGGDLASDDKLYMNRYKFQTYQL